MKGIVRTGIDVLILAIALVGSVVLRHEFDVARTLATATPIQVVAVVALQYGLLSVTGVLRGSWQFTSLRDAIDVVRGVGTAAAVLMLTRTALPRLLGVEVPAPLVLPYGVIVIDAALAVLGLVGVRMTRRLQAEAAEGRARATEQHPTYRTVLIGAGRTGVRIADALNARPSLGYRLVGFVDDDPALTKRRVSGLPVLGTTEAFETIAHQFGVQTAILAPEGPSGSDIRRLRDLCARAGVESWVVPSVYDLADGSVQLSTVRPVKIEDLLRRPPVELDDSSIRELISDDVVLVTGAGGSIGSELCRQILRFRPRHLVLVERSENALWAINRELQEVDIAPVTAYLADVCDATRMRVILQAEQPSVVFHAAAHKHVPMMEANPREAVINNAIGTQIVADESVGAGVGTFVLISTDKAVNPRSVMGATKRIAERYVQHLAHSGAGRYVAVRFGNVLGSTGSVVPIFQEQIAAGGPVTITHPAMQRYFMTIPEATQLVLQAAALGQDGEVFILDMGEPVRILSLAEDLIRLSGLTPHRDIEIIATGARPGEKLFEELTFTDEDVDRTRHPKIFVHRDGNSRWSTCRDDLTRLHQVATEGHEDHLRRAIRTLVPEFGDRPLETVPSGHTLDALATGRA